MKLSLSLEFPSSVQANEVANSKLSASVRRSHLLVPELRVAIQHHLKKHLSQQMLQKLASSAYCRE